MFKLAHLSDPHLGPLPAARPIELLSKRVSGYLSWHLNRRRIHRMEALQLVLEDIKSHQPDHVALTGDLINISLPGEYENASQWLKQLGASDWITLVPGNHDAYIARAWKEGIRAWSEYYAGDKRPDDAPDDGRLSPFPFVRFRRNVAIIGVSTAQPTAIGVAAGWLGAEQIEAVRIILAETRHRGFFRILLIHHPPVPGLCPRRKSLLDADRLAPVLAAEGAELVLFGHNHRHHHVEVSSKFGPIHLFGVPSASLGPDQGQAAGWNLYNVRRHEGSWITDVTVRSLDVGAGSMVTLDQLRLEQRRSGEVRDDK
jgi:3',5'-cyclic AMP phosphodiesterase CpdA